MHSADKKAAEIYHYNKGEDFTKIISFFFKQPTFQAAFGSVGMYSPPLKRCTHVHTRVYMSMKCSGYLGLPT